MDGTGSEASSMVSFVISCTESVDSAVLVSLISLHANESKFYWKNSKDVPCFPRFCIC
jgi:hypothetical protein